MKIKWSWNKIIRCWKVLEKSLFFRSGFLYEPCDSTNSPHHHMISFNLHNKQTDKNIDRCKIVISISQMSIKFCFLPEFSVYIILYYTSNKRCNEMISEYLVVIEYKLETINLNFDFRPCNYFDPNIPDMTQIGSIEEWLIGIKMERYIDCFVSAGFITMEHIANVTLKDLVELGITLVGHQKKILNSVQVLRAQLNFNSQQFSHGFLV